jgi:hypothetical protein
MENKTNNKQLFIGLAIAAVALVAGLGGFFSGVNYQKSRNKSSASLAAGNGDTGPTSFQGNGGPSFSGGGGGGGPMMGSGSLGTVTAISASSITVKNSRSGESSTYAIVSSTQITKDNTLASYTDITTNSTVMVTPDSANTGNALSIVVDPAFGNGTPSQSSIQTN